MFLAKRCQPDPFLKVNIYSWDSCTTTVLLYTIRVLLYTTTVLCKLPQSACILLQCTPSVYYYCSWTTITLLSLPLHPWASSDFSSTRLEPSHGSDGVHFKPLLLCLEQLYSRCYIDFLNLIYFWLCWVFVAVHWLSLFAGSGASLVVKHRR